MLGTDHGWLRHMALFDGVRDPAGIVVRPNKGLEAVAYLEVCRLSHIVYHTCRAALQALMEHACLTSDAFVIILTLSGHRLSGRSLRARPLSSGS